MNGFVQMSLKPLTLTLHLDPEHAELLRRLGRAKGGITMQHAVIELLREWDARPNTSPERAAEEVSWKREYFELASTSERWARKVLAAVGQESADTGKKEKRKKRREK